MNDERDSEESTTKGWGREREGSRLLEERPESGAGTGSLAEEWWGSRSSRIRASSESFDLDEESRGMFEVVEVASRIRTCW